jgi:hypothetical protein
VCRLAEPQDLFLHLGETFVASFDGETPRAIMTPTRGERRRALRNVTSEGKRTATWT